MADPPRGFLRRHARKFVISACTVGGAYALYKFAQWKWASRAAEEEARRLDVARLEHHFESNQRTCDMTARSLLPMLRTSLFEHVNVERLIVALKSSSSSNKSEVWNEVKTKTLTQLLVAVYSACFLHVFLRVQLNIIGGRLYLESAEKEDEEKKKKGANFLPITQTVQTRYLNLVECLFDTGMIGLVEFVDDVVERRMAEIGLKERFDATRFSQFVAEIRRDIEGDDQTSMDRLVSASLPTNGGIFNVNSQSLSHAEKDQLQGLVEATRDFLENPDFCHVLGKCIEAGFSVAVQSVERKINEDAVPLAKLLPKVVVDVVPTLLKDSSEFFNRIMELPTLQKFAENVYDAFRR